MTKTKRQKALKLKLKFRAPVSGYLLTEACDAAGVDQKKLMADPTSYLDDFSMTFQQAQKFMRVVLRRQIKLEKMPRDQAMAVSYFALTDFFLHTYLKHFDAQVPMEIRRPLRAS